MDFEYPPSYVCPITLDLMLEPVKASDNNIYDKPAIIDWYKQNKYSPLTREELSPEFILQNDLQNEIRTFIKEFNLVVNPYQPKNSNSQSNGISFNCLVCGDSLNFGNETSINCIPCRQKYILTKCRDCNHIHVIFSLKKLNFRCVNCGSINFFNKSRN